VRPVNNIRGPLIADFDLDLPIRGWSSVAEVFNGEPAGVTVPEQRVVKLDRLNEIRRHTGKAELLEHVEVFTSLGAQRDGNRTNIDANTRIGRRLHHVRGHLARRGYNIFWHSLGTASGASPGVKHFRTLSSNPYNALQPFTTNALCDAEL
jgi:hypothetical protein